MRLYCIFIFCVLYPSLALAASQVFYEDNEASDFTDFFLERHYGTTYQEYWNELTSEITRSTESSHSGNYCMTYDPWLTDNPHSIIGYDTTFGNTSAFLFRPINARYWYFRWYQRWERNIDYSGSIENKLLYINYRDEGDFVFTVKKRESYKFHITVKDHDTYSLVRNDYFHTVNDISLDDMQWHKLELFIDTGITGASNGSYWFKIDNVNTSSADNIRFNATVSPNPIDHITGWPSNAPRASQPLGTGRTWLDDLEIYTLDGPNDIPPEIDGVPWNLFLPAIIRLKSPRN